VQLASGITEVARQAAMAQVNALAEEILANSRSNGELLVGLVRAEVDRAVGSLGLVTREEFEGLRRRVDRVVAADDSSAKEDSGHKVSPKKVSTKKVTPKKAAEKKTAAKRATTKNVARSASPTSAREE